MLAEPIRIVAKGDAASVAAATILFSFFHENNRKCSLRVVSYYNEKELNSLLLEEYPSFIVIDCKEEAYRQKLNAIYMDSMEAYKMARKHPHLMLAGFFARHTEYGTEIPDEILGDALKSGYISVQGDLPEINESLYQNISLHGFRILKKLADFAEMIIACIRSGKPAAAISAILGNEEQAVPVWVAYRKEVHKAAELLTNNMERYSISGNGAQVVNMRDYIMPYIAGSLAKKIAKDSIAIVMAYSDNKIRFSVRADNKSADLIKLTAKIMEKFEGEFGGDSMMAGGTIFRYDEEKFVSEALKVIEQAATEESVS